MLIGLFTLLTILLGGGDATPFILPKAEKVVKQTVEDSDRKKDILAEVKIYTKEWKKLQKTKKKQAKAISKMNKDYSADHQAIADEFQKYRDERKRLSANLTMFRLTVQEMFTEQEWSAIIDQAVNLKPKKEKKLNKAQAKELVTQDKQIGVIESEIEAAFDNSEKRELAKKDLLAFEDDMANLLVENQSYTSTVVEVMKDQQVSQEEIEEVTNLQEKIRAEAHASFLELRKNLVEISTEDNWPKLAKALGKFIK